MPPLNVSYRIEGSLDVPALSQALDEIVQQHDALRLAFSMDAAGGTEQRLDPTAQPRDPLERKLIRASSREQFDEYARLRFASDMRQIWNSPAIELFKFTLLRADADYHAFLATVNHLVFDARSMAVFERELWRRYASRAAGDGADVTPPVIPRFLTAARRQRDRFARRAETVSRRYWERKLAGVPPFTQFSLLAVASPNGGADLEYRDELDAAAVRGLRERCGRLGCSLPQWILALFLDVLFAVTGLDRIVVTVPISARGTADNDVIGMFAGSYPIVVDRTPDGLAALARNVRAEILGAVSNRYVDGRVILSALRRNAQRFGTRMHHQVHFSYLEMGRQASAVSRATGLRITRNLYRGDTRGTPGVALSVIARRDRLMLSLLCNPAVVPAELSGRISRGLAEITRSEAGGPDLTPRTEPAGRAPATPIHRLTDGQGRVVLGVDLGKVKAALAGRDYVQHVDVTPSAGPDGLPRLSALVRIAKDAAGVSSGQLRERCYQLSRTDPTVIAPAEVRVIRQSPGIPGTALPAEGEPPGPARLLAVLRGYVADADRGFWEAGGSFEAIRAIGLQAARSGLPAPRPADYVDALCLRSIARRAFEPDAGAGQEADG
jgi:Condensation domain